MSKDRLGLAVNMLKLSIWKDRPWIVIGSGDSITKQLQPQNQHAILVSCNRTIEFFQSDYWIWVDRHHFDRSKTHANAVRARWVGNVDHATAYGRSDMDLFQPIDSPDDDDGLFLHGGTLTVAAHFAIRKGAQRIIFLGCDGWREDQDRYHSWDGKPLDAAGIEVHRIHLRKTAEGIAILRRAYPAVEFFDATPENRHLGCPFFDLDQLRDPSMPIESTLPIHRDTSIPAGYGRLVSVTPLSAGEVVMWYEDPCGTVRGLRMACDTSNGLALVPKGQAVVERT